MSQRFEGRNLEEALQQAAQTFGVERWQLTYHVLLEKRGFLGGMKRVVVEAEVNTEAPPPAAAPAASAPAARPAELRDPRAPRPERGGRPSRGGGGGRSHDREGSRGRGGRRGGGGGGRDRDDRPRRELRSGDFEAFMGEIPEQGPESDQAKVVRDWVEGVIFLAKLDVVARTEENDTQIIIKLYGSDGSLLTDKGGEVLDAIQVLANKALVGRKVEKEIELDCEQFKNKREEELAKRAREVADRVRRDGREELLPPMTPIERRIVHVALRDDADVTTDSRGDGFYKRVAIILCTVDSPTTTPES
jgi:predicted RNA-binding protein Jag